MMRYQEEGAFMETLSDREQAYVFKNCGRCAAKYIQYELTYVTMFGYIQYELT